MVHVPVGGDFPKHFDGKRFFNPDGRQALGLADVIRWQLTHKPERSPEFVNDVQATIPPKQVDGSKLRATFINHSTVLLQQSGATILTDPIWSLRASPVTMAGPRRRRDPGVRLNDLPPVDTVLLSHNHYDHLDLATLRLLAARGNSTFIAPLGVGRLLEANGIRPAYELDWGESRVAGGATIHCVPAMHFSARGLFDRNATLWCGYMIESASGLVYFAADTGFGKHFAQIRERFGAPMLALLPIGAYEPRWFMSPIHMAPEEAVRAHQILGSRTSIAIHHGTFQLADEGLDTPKRVLLDSGAPPSFVTLSNGEALELAW